MADNIQVLDATRTLQTTRSTESGGVHLPHRRIEGEILPSALIWGKTTLAGSSAQALVGAETLSWKGVRLLASDGNVGVIYVGGSGLTSDGYPLMPGEHLDVYIRDLQDVEVLGTLGDSIRYFGS